MQFFQFLRTGILGVLALGINQPLTAAVNVSGLFDFRYQDVEMPGGFNQGTYHSTSPNFTLGQMTLFVDGPISENMYFNGEVQTDIFNTATPPQQHNFRLRSGSVTILNMGGTHTNLEVGRFDSIQGTFSERRLGLDNPLLDAPLAYSYRVNLDPDGGFVPNGEVRVLSMIDKDMIQTGARVFGRLRESKLHWDLALHNNAISNPRATNINNTLGLTSRFTWRGDADSAMGITFSRAGYMDSLANLANPASANYRGPRLGRNSEAEYRQTLFTAFLQQRWHRFDFNMEYLSSTWEVPNLANNRNELDSSSYYAEVKYSFTKNLFAAGRYDVLDFDNATRQSINVTPRTWDFDVTRSELGIGTFVNDNALAKLSYQMNDVKTPVAIQRDFNVVSGSLTVAF